MRALLLPVKNLTQAKSRLRHLLLPEERLALAEALLTDTLRTLGGVRRAEKIFVVTDHPRAIDAAERNGISIETPESEFSWSVAIPEFCRQYLQV